MVSLEATLSSVPHHPSPPTRHPHPETACQDDDVTIKRNLSRTSSRRFLPDVFDEMRHHHRRDLSLVAKQMKRLIDDERRAQIPELPGWRRKSVHCVLVIIVSKLNKMKLMKLASKCLLLAALFDSSSLLVQASSKVNTAPSSLAPRQQAVLPPINKDVKPAKVMEGQSILQTIQRGGNSAIPKDAITGAIILACIERGTNKLFQQQGITFPSQLGGCIALFLTLLIAQGVSPGLGDTILDLLNPGSALLAKWLPAFFVPGLAMLPLAPTVGNGLEIAKVLMIVVLGFLYSLSTVSFSVLFLRAAQGNIVKVPAPVRSIKKRAAAVPTVAAKPYSEETLSFLIKGTLVSGIISLLATRAGNDYITPLQTIFLGFATFASFVWSARLPSNFVKVVHPLITSTTLVWGVLRLIGMATGASFSSVLKTYKVGSLNLMKAGAGDLMLFLLGPTVVSFSLAMYSRRQLLKENLLIVITAMLVSSVGGLFGTAAFCRLIALGGSAGGLIRRSVLSRNVTTALAMAITAILGGDISIAASVVTLTGILGATYGRSLLDKMGISDPVTRGLGVGASAQGLGVSSLLVEPDAFPFAAMSMVLTAVSATVLVSIPAVKDALINLAGP